ncbi:MAG: TRAP transporter substrate-binding protein DctP [Alphaproteobacteria bacterium]
MKYVFFAAALVFACLQSVAAQTVIEVALPTAKEHIRNQALERWAAKVAAESGNRLVVRLRHDETRFDGAHVINAVAEGVFDMAVPGWWHVARIVPDFRVSALPAFYGRSGDDAMAVFDGPLGRELDGALEQAINVRVLGRRINLGLGQIYLSARKAESYADLDGLNIRVPGGSDDLARYLVLGATPRRVPLANLKGAMQDGLIGGLLTTHSFVRDEALWDAGVKYAFIDDQVFYQYTPIMNRRRWDAFSDAERALLTESWDAAVDDMRGFAAREQSAARDVVSHKGIAFATPSKDDRKAMRLNLLREQPALVTALEMDKGFVARVQAALDAIDRQRGD